MRIARIRHGTSRVVGLVVHSSGSDVLLLVRFYAATTVASERRRDACS